MTGNRGFSDCRLPFLTVLSLNATDMPENRSAQSIGFPACLLFFHTAGSYGPARLAVCPTRYPPHTQFRKRIPQAALSGTHDCGLYADSCHRTKGAVRLPQRDAHRLPGGSSPQPYAVHKFMSDEYIHCHQTGRGTPNTTAARVADIATHTLKPHHILTDS